LAAKLNGLNLNEALKDQFTGSITCNATVGGEGRHAMTVMQPNPRHFVLVCDPRGGALHKSLRVVVK
jgi:hypothetical protein